jgi:hypothetical protein
MQNGGEKGVELDDIHITQTMAVDELQRVLSLDAKS